jgi:hypothetical protein
MKFYNAMLVAVMFALTLLATLVAAKSDPTRNGVTSVTKGHDTTNVTKSHLSPPFKPPMKEEMMKTALSIWEDTKNGQRSLIAKLPPFLSQECQNGYGVHDQRLFQREECVLKLEQSIDSRSKNWHP